MNKEIPNFDLPLRAVLETDLGAKGIAKCDDEAHWLILRKPYITSTNSATIMGVNKYESRIGLWAIKTGKMEDEVEQNLAMQIGKLVEPIIAQLTMEHYNVSAFKDTDLHIRGADKIATSLDYVCEKPSEEMIALHPDIKPDSMVILECKNVGENAYRNLWVDGKPPLYIQCQVQHQLMCTGYDFAIVCALVGGNRMEYVFVKRDEVFMTALLHEIKEFWKLVDDKIEPEVEQTDNARKVFEVLYPKVEGKVIDLRFDNQIDHQINEQKILASEATTIKKKNDAIKTEIKDKLGDAQIGITNEFKISIGNTNRLNITKIKPSDEGLLL